VNFIISKRHGNSFRRDPRLTMECQRDREKTKTFINNPSFRMTFFLWLSLVWCALHYLLRILLITFSQLVFFCVLFFRFGFYSAGRSFDFDIFGITWILGGHFKLPWLMDTGGESYHFDGGKNLSEIVQVIFFCFGRKKKKVVEGRENLLRFFCLSVCVCAIVCIVYV
jgi:hypothetical protein